jgi:hypothetical protein
MVLCPHYYNKLGCSLFGILYIKQIKNVSIKMFPLQGVRGLFSQTFNNIVTSIGLICNKNLPT